MSHQMTRRTLLLVLLASSTVVSSVSLPRGAVSADLPLPSPTQTPLPPEFQKRLDDLGFDAKTASSAFRELQRTFHDKNFRRLSRMALFPINIRIRGQVRQIRSPAEFSSYKRVIFRELQSTVLNQDFETLFANAEGLMVGNGQVWLSQRCKNADCSEQTFGISSISLDK